MNLGSRLRALRQERGLTLEKLETRSGVPAEAIGRFERGRTMPSVPTIEKLASGLGLALADVFATTATDDATPAEVRQLVFLLKDQPPATLRRALRLVEVLLAPDEAP